MFTRNKSNVYLNKQIKCSSARNKSSVYIQKSKSSVYTHTHTQQIKCLYTKKKQIKCLSTRNKSSICKKQLCLHMKQQIKFLFTRSYLYIRNKSRIYQKQIKVSHTQNTNLAVCKKRIKQLQHSETELDRNVQIIRPADKCTRLPLASEKLPLKLFKCFRRGEKNVNIFFYCPGF